jgi:hypothetical protein
LTLLTAVFVRGHRAIFTAATAALGVSASFLADSPGEVGNWLLLVGSGLIMGAEDLCREVETDARLLTKATKTALSQTRRDVLATHHPLIVAAALALGFAAMAGGLVVRST